ncbi:GIY-YIG nuclease family protein [Sphingopyxis sp. PAMC25046]|uniref:GIY-YIG nuclease family protein n=1 Tax=Sphingopyxis sp. PAMC25046 TaxID=2565556 RepID=UPI00109D916D|nr:GIY-YIG nuclease family protein [Sphingopyxis sp. PAMC25046]QCB53830.1 GIY-YIG nuclease family protein [Sphingopyxis sp. PAMC25046]
MAFWTYMLRCSDGRYYTGHTDNLERRIAQHQHGGFCDFTSRRRPVALVWSQDFATRAEALEAERRIKPWSRAKKKALVRGDWKMVGHFAKPPHERPPLPFAPKDEAPYPFVPSPSTALAGARDKLPAWPEVEGREAGRKRVSTSLDTNGGGGMADREEGR